MLKLMKDAANPENANVQPQQPDYSRAYGGDEDENSTHSAKYGASTTHSFSASGTPCQQRGEIHSSLPVQPGKGHQLRPSPPLSEIRGTTEKCLSQTRRSSKRHAPRRPILPSALMKKPQPSRLSSSALIVVDAVREKLHRTAAVSHSDAQREACEEDAARSKCSPTQDSAAAPIRCSWRSSRTNCSTSCATGSQRQSARP